MSCEQAISASPFPPHLSPAKPAGAGKQHALSTASVAAGLKRSKPLTPSSNPRLRSDAFREHRAQSIPSASNPPRSGGHRDLRSQSPSSNPRLRSNVPRDGRSQSPGASPRLSGGDARPDIRTQSPGSSPRLRGADTHRELPPGWEKVHSDQGMYYWHKETQRTRWKFPEDEAKEYEKVKRKHRYVNIKPKHLRRSGDDGGQQNGSGDSHASSDDSSLPSDHEQQEEQRASNGGDAPVQPRPPGLTTPADSRGNGVSQTGAAGSMASASPSTTKEKSDGSDSGANGNGHQLSGSAAGESIKRLPHYVNVKPTQYLRTNTAPADLNVEENERVLSNKDAATNGGDHGNRLESTGAEASADRSDEHCRDDGGPRERLASPPSEDREAREGDKIKRLPRYVNVKPTHYLRTDPSPPAVPQSDGSETLDGDAEGRRGHAPPGGSRDVTPTPSSPPPEDREERTPTPPLPDRQYADSEARRSPTPPLPDRQYVDSEARRSPTPPLPERRYELSPSPPPPLPARRYSDHEEMSQVRLRRAGLTKTASENGHLESDLNHHRGNSDAESQSESDGMRRMVTSFGDEYTLVTKQDLEQRRPVSWAESSFSASYATIPPTLPAYTLESRQVSEEEGRASSASSQIPYSARYVDLDTVDNPHRVRSRVDPYRDSIAYAIVTLDDARPQQDVALEEKTEKEGGFNRSATPPEPYEIPMKGGTLPGGAGASSGGGVASGESKRLVPGMSGPPGTYEEIDFASSSQQSAGYMTVNHDVQKGYRALQRYYTSSPDLQAQRRRKTFSADDGSHSPSPPPLPDNSPPSRENRKHRSDFAAKSKSLDIDFASSTVGDRGSSPGESASPHSPSPVPNAVFDNQYDQLLDAIPRVESVKYDLPLNSRRIKAMNLTLPRTLEAEDSPPPPGYSKLGLSREAILLRSGVTLRRNNQFSFAPFKVGEGKGGARGGANVKDEGRSSGTSTESDEDDGLDAVNKCIKSLESSLSLKGDQEYAGYIKMQRAPVGPPKWKEFRRRPHEYEDVGHEQGEEDDAERGGALSQGPLTTSRSMDHLDADLEWDESDFTVNPASQNPQRGAGPLGSLSQPDLRPPSLSESPANAFPHMQRPERVSLEAFNRRKLRLLQHKYVDLDIAEWPDVVGPESAGSIGGAQALTTMIRDSWLESDKQSPPGHTLPRGWQRLKDEEGRSYYWHVPTGRTQYTKPTGEEVRKLSLNISLSRDGSPSRESPITTRAKSQTFSARYLGFQPVQESELIPGQCVKVVHSCIHKITSARSKQGSAANKGKVVFIQVQGMELKWLEPETSATKTVQPVNRIRVWGIGLENERDFGYVARDPVTKKHRCHVFRCDMPARAVARALLESHQREKRKSHDCSHDQRMESSLGASSSSVSADSGVTRSFSPEAYDPVGESLAGGGRSGGARRSLDGSLTTSTSSSVSSAATSATSATSTTSDDRYTRISCTYIGSCDVAKPVGMEVLNEAVGRLSSNQLRWLDVNLDVATSHIKIVDTKTDKVIREHRVRFLCFLGIGRDDRYCGYIIDSGERGGQKHYKFHGFRKEPNTDSLCLALHLACQARYQRVLNANPAAAKKLEDSMTQGQERVRSKSTNSLFGRLGSFKKTKNEDSRCHSFVVQYLGSVPVAKSEGLETVKGPVQQLSFPKKTASTPPHLVEFEVSPGGMAITDHQRRLFARKTFSVKNITYVVRIRNYFAFIARESGKYHCYVFLESEVDAGTIVTTIQRLLAPAPSPSSTKQQRKK